MTPVPQIPVVAASAKKPGVPDPPVDVRCAGPFQFDLIRNVATFVEQVKVVRVFPDGQTDRLDCDWLAVHFTPKATAAKADSPTLDGSHEPAGGTGKRSLPVDESSPNDTGRLHLPVPHESSPADGSPAPADKSAGSGQKMPSLEPSRIEARGKPVILRAVEPGLHPRRAPRLRSRDR